MTTRPATAPDSDSPRFLTVDAHVPATIRQLLDEADGCVKMSFLTGGTACARRALQAVFETEEAQGEDYNESLSLLSQKHPAVAPPLFQILALLGASEEPLEAGALNALVVTLKAIAYEIYVLGPERIERLMYVHELVESLNGGRVLPHPATKTRKG